MQEQRVRTLRCPFIITMMYIIKCDEPELEIRLIHYLTSKFGFQSPLRSTQIDNILYFSQPNSDNVFQQSPKSLKKCYHKLQRLIGVQGWERSPYALKSAHFIGSSRPNWDLCGTQRILLHPMGLFRLIVVRYNSRGSRATQECCGNVEI